MNLFKRITTLFLVLSMMFALAACGEVDKNNRGKADSVSTQTATKFSDEKLVEEYKKLLEGYTKELTGLDKDEVAFTVNGEAVTVEEMLYHYTSLALYNVNNYLQQGMSLDMSAEHSNGGTVADYLFSQAADNAAYYTMMRQKAVEYECELTDEQMKVWEDALAQYLENNGEKGYYSLLAMYGLSEDLFVKINLNEDVVQNVATAIYPNPSEGDLDLYIEDYDILSCKHILLYTVEDDGSGGLKYSVSGGKALSPEGEAYSGTPDEVNKEILARAEEILKEINETEDPIAKFDELMHAYSQDSGLANSPDGYTFTAGEMVAAFEDTTRSLEYGEISEVVQSPYGYHIILRQRPDVHDAYVEGYLNMQFTSWLSLVDIQTTKALDKMDPLDIFNKYSEYQGRLGELGA